MAVLNRCRRMTLPIIVNGNRFQRTLISIRQRCIAEQYLWGARERHAVRCRCTSGGGSIPYRPLPDVRCLRTDHDSIAHDGIGLRLYCSSPIAFAYVFNRQITRSSSAAAAVTGKPIPPCPHPNLQTHAWSLRGRFLAKAYCKF
jgi:hypothetical protein